MKWLLGDSEVWLMLMLLIVGAIPAVADGVRARPLGAEATIGGVVAVSSAVALVGRASKHLRAAAILRRLKTTR